VLLLSLMLATWSFWYGNFFLSVVDDNDDHMTTNVCAKTTSFSFTM
jgi:hypothetical protein